MGLFARRNILTLLILICLFNTIEVSADSPGRPQPYAFEAGDYIYVQFAGFSAENKDEYLESKAKFYNKQCKNRKQQTDYIKRWCYTLDVIKRYPHSGVFRKDDPPKPVWWGGRCAGASYMTSDAEYIVMMGPWPSHIDQLAVRFCKRHKIIAEYSISDLIDDESRLPWTTSHFSWESEIIFDDKTSTLFVKTLDNNEYTFDVRTGKIIKYKFTPFKVYEAHVFYKNGKHKLVRDLTSCSGMTYATLFMGNGFPVHQLQVVEPVKKEKGGELVQMGAIPFEYIKKARFVSKAEKRAIWEITTLKGESGQVMLDSSEADLCGKDNKGEKVNISVMDIDSLDLSEVKPSASGAGIRTVEQRMRWDIKQWEKARRDVCDNPRVEQFNTARDLKKMIRQYQIAKCTDISENFVMAMDKINQWLQQQRTSTEMLTTSQEVAKFQLRSGFPNQALDLYEYLLKSYQQKYGKSYPRMPDQKTYLLQQMLSASYQAGLLADYKKYQKLHEKYYAIVQERNEERRKKRHEANRQKIKDYQQSIENVLISSVKPDHGFPGDMRRLLEWECRDEKKTVNSAADTFKSILTLERKLHPKGHVHVLEAAIALSDCHKQKKNYVEAKKSFDKVLSLYLQMDKKGVLSSENSLAINRELMKLTVRITPDRSELIDEKIALNLRKLLRDKESNNEKEMFYTLRALAWNYSLVGDHTKAEKYYKERIKLSAKLSKKSLEMAESDLERYYEQRENLKQK